MSAEKQGKRFMAWAVMFGKQSIKSLRF